MVRKGGLEPPHLSVPDPKSGASANSATFAIAKARITQAIIRYGIANHRERESHHQDTKTQNESLTDFVTFCLRGGSPCSLLFAVLQMRDSLY